MARKTGDISVNFLRIWRQAILAEIKIIIEVYTHQKK
jgi:hypothetical protein